MTVAVSACDLTIGWSRDAILLEHASFVVERGEVFGLLGRSAAGKSTLMRVLIGLERPFAGHVAIHVDPSGDAASGRPSFGVMFQQGALFGSMTIAENIELPLARWTRLPPSAIRAIARAKLRLVGLEAAENELPAALSGGMRKRAALARALALEPSLVFLDEPSSGLDPITSAELDRLIRTLARALDLTIVLVTHELGSIDSIVDHCIVLDAETRSIIAEGTPRQLHSDPNPHVQHFFARMPENV
ncbi:MAG TPA: ATP-binding cassette domain-containing protein [Kofleriaceae bacterium]